MDSANFGDNRWHIMYGDYSGFEKKAADCTYAAVAENVRYILTIGNAADSNSDIFEEKNIVLLGTPKSNKYIKQFIDKYKIELPTSDEGFIIKSFGDDESSSYQIIILAANNPKGLLYAAQDFLNKYISAAKCTGHHQPYMNPIFSGKMPPVEMMESPSIDERGIWTWGHVIYNYRAYLDNMVKLKLNLLVIWNDYAPINAKDIVGYAHENGIKIVWGYSWGWGEDVDISCDSALNEWSKRAVEKYENEYAALGGDGIYFQSFTETVEDNINGVPIAEKATKWVNTISEELLSKYPDLKIMFGLHATSVKSRLNVIADVNPAVTIIWEDAGAFPYNYMPQNVSDFNETLSLTREISVLRGKEDKFGAVLKGLTALDWSCFEHQKGKYILGETTIAYRHNRLNEKEQLWKCMQAHWLANNDYARQIVSEIYKQKNGKASIQLLAEDGMIEEKIFYPLALFAEFLWNSEKSANETAASVAMFPDVAFANGK